MTHPFRCAVVVLLGALAGPAGGAEPGPIPDRVREEWKLDRFYQKYADAGVLVVGSAKVSDHALAEAAWIVGRMLDGRKDVLDAMRKNRVRVVVMAATEYTTDVPEHARMKPKLYWDRRARGLGATLANPAVSCGEENLLGYAGDPYPGENIFVHEFAHAIHGTGLSTTDPTFDKRLRAAYQAALDRGLWKNTYAATNHSEYWAEGVQCWFDDNAPPDALHNEVRTRGKLTDYDPALAALCKEVFGNKDWRYQRPAKRKPEDTKHLAGYDPKRAPRFEWRDAPLGARPRATLQTEVGDFDVELDAKVAPEAAALFLKAALEGGYHSGAFDRATRTGQTPPAGTVGASPSAAWIERTAKGPKVELAASKEKPADGTIALVRGGTAPGAFVVFVGAPPADGAGDVIPFGKVVKGADVVAKLLAAERDGKLNVGVRRVIRTE
ncbi:peptidylprolyl isomerase [Gemmata sp. JC673]|uniref:Peptidylprolyl isomerase n=1 Tax=Gemmata algarum TaxID=2975278 RepID=A0ABU5F595_9BACT|nr:peptidylprolyl isomerase [Gemmata algarum]MDY3561056.1 peptidylprolyl isomerase [Gemmata algarum]